MFSEFCELLWHIDWTQGGVHRNLWFTASPSEAQVTTQDFQLELKWGQSCETEIWICGTETEQDPVGLLAMKVFLCPPFPDLPWVPKGRFKHGREEMKRQGRNKQQQCSLEKRSWFPQKTRKTVSLSSSENPNKQKTLTTWGILYSREKSTV